LLQDVLFEKVWPRDYGNIGYFCYFGMVYVQVFNIAGR